MLFFFGRFKNYKGEIDGGFYRSGEEWARDTFCPDTELLALIDLSVHGKTYAERKEDVRDKAHQYLDLYSNSVPLSWSEVASFDAYFTEQGKRYGLLKEFKENCIC